MSAPRRLPAILLAGLLAATAASPLPAATPVGGEYIVVSGGPSLHEWERFKTPPHDRWWGNFIRTARVRIEELRQQYGGEQAITWLVHRPSYARRVRQGEGPLLENILSVRDRYGLNLVWFTTGQEVVDYLNAGRPRHRVKITGFEYFGHSNSKCFMFDYSNEIDSGSKAWLHETELGRIHRGIFARRAFVKSWGCHTGESMGRRWRQATGARMIGAVGKTDYSNGRVPVLSSENGRWVP